MRRLLAGLLVAICAAGIAVRAATAAEAPVVTVPSVALPAAGAGEPYAARIAAEGGGAWRFSLARGRLPRGLRLHRDGRIDGTPRRAQSVTFSVRLVRRGRPVLRLTSLCTLRVRAPVAWTRLGETSPPAARWGHAGALDVRRGRLVVMGGGSGVNWLNDAHALDIATGTWQTVGDGTGAPPGRWGHSLVIDDEGDRAIVFGGMSVQPYGDVWAIDLATGAWSELHPAGPAPSARRSHVAAMDPATRRMLVFGGSGLAGDVGDVWSLDLAGPGAPRWTELTPSGDAPAPRSFASAAFDREAGRWYVVGGVTAEGPSSEVFVLDLAAAGGPSWTRLTPTGEGPGAISSAATAFDGAGNRVLVYGGDASGALRGTVHALRLGGAGGPAWELVAALDEAGPGARASSVGAFDPASSRLVVVMGNDGALRDDAWALEVAAAPRPSPDWTSTVAAGPTARMNHTLVADPSRGRVVLFAGFDGTYRADAWSLDLAGAAAPTWTPLAADGPAPRARFAHAAVLDASRDRMLVVAGSDGTSGGFEYFDDVWSLDLAAPAGVASWTEILPSGPGPAPRDEHVAVLDPASDRVLVFGGFDDFTVFGDLWALDLVTTTWTQISPPGDAPVGRAGAAAVFDPVGRRMLLHGGGDGARFLDDLWSLDCSVAGAETWIRLDLPDAPAGRSLHVMVADPAGPSVVLAGGQALASFGDAHRLVLGAGPPRWERLPDVPARASAAGSYDAATRSVVLHGGLGPSPRAEIHILPPR